MDISTSIGVFFWGTASMAMVAALARDNPEMKALELVLKGLIWPRTFFEGK